MSRGDNNLVCREDDIPSVTLSASEQVSLIEKLKNCSVKVKRLSSEEIQEIKDRYKSCRLSSFKPNMGSAEEPTAGPSNSRLSRETKKNGSLKRKSKPKVTFQSGLKKLPLAWTRNSKKRKISPPTTCRVPLVPSTPIPQPVTPQIKGDATITNSKSAPASPLAIVPVTNGNAVKTDNDASALLSQILNNDDLLEIDPNSDSILELNGSLDWMTDLLDSYLDLHDTERFPDVTLLDFGDIEQEMRIIDDQQKVQDDHTPNQPDADIPF